MSSILMSNPFPAPPPPTSHTAEMPNAAAAVAPVQSGAGASSSDNAAAFSGFGAGTGRQAENVALFQAKDAAKWGRPTDATGSSVITAQALGTVGESVIEDLPLGPDLPEVEMPDPLPTSPFLKQNEFVA